MKENTFKNLDEIKFVQDDVEKGTRYYPAATSGIGVPGINARNLQDFRPGRRPKRCKKPRAVPDHCWPQGGIPGAGLAEVSSPGKARPRRPGGNQPRTWPLLKLEEDSKSDMQYMQRASHLLEALLLRIDESSKILDNRQEKIRKHKKIVRFEDEREILKAIGGSADRQGAALQWAARRLEARWVSDAGLRQHFGRFQISRRRVLTMADIEMKHFLQEVDRINTHFRISKMVILVAHMALQRAWGILCNLYPQRARPRRTSKANQRCLRWWKSTEIVKGQPDLP